MGAMPQLLCSTDSQIFYKFLTMDSLLLNAFFLCLGCAPCDSESLTTVAGAAAIGGNNVQKINTVDCRLLRRRGVRHFANEQEPCYVCSGGSSDCERGKADPGRTTHFSVRHVRR